MEPRENLKVSKGAKIRNRYNQVPHLTQDTNGKVTNSQLDTTNEGQEVSPFPAGDHKAHINRRSLPKNSYVIGLVYGAVILFGNFHCLIWESFPIQKWPLFSQFHVI